MMNFVFVTGNQDKVFWLEHFLGQKVEHHKLDLTEIQSLDPNEVVRHKTTEAYKNLKRPVLIEDTAVSFTALGRLPGTFIKYFLEEIGNQGLCDLLDNQSNRSATVIVTYGLFDGNNFQVFESKIKGQIASEPRGNFGHGWDPIFIPDGQPKTFGEMNKDDYSTYSVRKKAVIKLKGFITQ